jgi:hypothetical protein
MKKKIRKLVAVAMVAAMGIALTGCYGSFNMTKKVHAWNGSLGNKFVQEAVFLGLIIIPVYEVAALLDAVILNTVEFWTGSNPMALKPGTNQIEVGGEMLTVNVMEDKVTIKNSKEELLSTLTFNENDNSWYTTSKGETTKLLTIEEENLKLYSKSGKVMEVAKPTPFNNHNWLMYNEFSAMR